MYNVVIASLPDAPLILDALGSIHEQSLAPDEVFVIVDANADVPSAWAERIEGRFPRTSVHRQDACGMASAVASGIRRSTSKYVAFLDADDMWRPGKQEFQMAVLEADPTVDAVTCLATNLELGADGSERSLNSGPSATFTATTFRRDAFDRFGFPGGEAGHFVWLYRWWSNARRLGIRTEHVSEQGLLRRIDGNNSWFVANDLAHRELRLELHRLVKERRSSGPE